MRISEVVSYHAYPPLMAPLLPRASAKSSVLARPKLFFVGGEQGRLQSAHYLRARKQPSLCL